MTMIHTQQNWMIKVFGDEHPPIHVHVIHPDGKALIYLDGRILNRSVPVAVVKAVVAWVAANHDAVRAEWRRLDNLEYRGENT